MPITEEIDRDRALELLHEAVEDRGANHRYPSRKTGPLDATGEPAVVLGVVEEYDYGTVDLDRQEAASCHYFATERDAALVKNVAEGAPMCIVGWVLDRLGVTPDELSRDDNIAAGFEHLVAYNDWSDWFTHDAARVLAVAQEQQDGGLPWGQAVQVAESWPADDF